MNYIMLMFFQKAIVLREHLKCVDVFYRFLMQRIGRPRIRSHEGFAKATLQNVSKPSPEGGSGTPYTFSSCWPGYIDPENHLVDTNLPTLSGRVYVNLRDGICDYSYFYYYLFIYIYICVCVFVCMTMRQLRIVIRSVWSFIWMLVMRRHGGTHLNSPILQGSVSKFARFEHFVSISMFTD
jgi:hypothetical protein